MMSTASSSLNTHWIHHVFLNFRGEDKRKTIVSHLHAALSNAGINTFIDNNILRGTVLGAELVRAIQGSQISIVVFSDNYASSKWCLNELVEIMECHREYGQMVLPLFYVDPAHVRHQKGDFGQQLEALAQNCLPQGLNDDVLRSWKTSLTAAADLAGWDARNFWSESELVKEIVEYIMRNLDNDLMSVPEFPVGLEWRAQVLIEFINGRSGRSSLLGIWGMGGSGKTTLAKVIYNQFRKGFTRRSFIETNNRGCIDLQEKLLSDVLKTRIKIHSIAMGISLIKNKLYGEKVLIVLDDVTEFEQLKALCGNGKWFGEGSVIIISTRDVRLLKLLKVDYVYTMEEMDENESLELFSWHAFGEAKPSEDFNELARNVVAYCGGLPVALEVLGSYLIERTKKEWESVLSKLETIPDDRVQRILRISFDGLCNHMEKDIFLDVCCFFIGKDRDYVTEILNGCGLHADIGITILIERGLIKIEKNNKLGMHPLLRELGREIIRESSRKEPGKRSRLWLNEDVVRVLTENTGTEAVEGLALTLHLTSRDCFEAYAFKGMKRLRLLQLDHVQLSGDYGYLSKHLRWVRWHGFPSKYIPINFSLKDVIAIDLRHSNIRIAWKQPQVLGWLKMLNLSHSKYLIETPDFSKLPNLEKLILKDCPSLCKVHQSIGDLHNLLLINLKDCISLSNLPRETYKLKSVRTLILSGCSKIDKLEEDIEQMESLTTLLADNTAVKQVSFSIVRSKSIGYISLCGFEGLARNVFPSIIQSWMSPTMNPLLYISPFSGTSCSLVPMNTQNNTLGELAPMLRSLPYLRSVLVQCETEFQLSKHVKTIMDEDILNFTELGISRHHLRSSLIGVESYKEFFDIFIDRISEVNSFSSFYLSSIFSAIRNVFPSIIQSWMSQRMNPLLYLHPFSGTSCSLVSMNTQNSSLGELAPMLRSLPDLRSVLVQCETEFQLSKHVNTILVEDVVNFTELGISRHHLRSSLIGVGSYKEFFDILSDRISEGFATNEACEVLLPGDNYPYWLAHTGEGRSVYFTVPENCSMKGMALCIVYLSNPEIMATESLTSILIANYTKCTLHIHKQDTVISFNDEDWQEIISHLGGGDNVEIFVTFGHHLVVKKTAVYLLCDESIEMEIEPYPEPKKNASQNL